MEQSTFLKSLERRLAIGGENPTPEAMHKAVAEAVWEHIAADWNRLAKERATHKRAAYLSAEFLVGRAVYNNMLSLGLTQETEAFFREKGLDFAAMEELTDPALGNGGLGRLAACYLDSAATHGISLDGYGIRYQYGLFRQSFEERQQKEMPDDWNAGNDPWSQRREDKAVTVRFWRQAVRAVPYDTPIVGYGGRVGRLRLWQAEPINEFD